MSKRFVPLLLAGLVALAGLALADEPPPDQGEAPVRLKKKNKPKGDDKPMPEPAKPAEKKDDKKEPGKAGEPKEPEEEPAAPQEDEKEVLQRVSRNARVVEEKLAKNDLGEGTRQSQRDILNDIESLIKRSERPQGGAGQQNQNQQQNQGGGEQGDAQEQKGGQQGGSQGAGGQKSQGGSQGSGASQRPGGSGSQPGGGGKSGSRPGSGTQSGAKSGAGTQPGGTKSGSGTRPGGAKPGAAQGSKDGKSGENGENGKGGKNGKNGNGGGGGDKEPPGMNRSADAYKTDVWGHLPPALRAQMNAYSNPEPFMAKYDDLIKRYYRTIAEQGRRKGE